MAFTDTHSSFHSDFKTLVLHSLTLDANPLILQHSHVHFIFYFISPFDHVNKTITWNFTFSPAISISTIVSNPSASLEQHARKCRTTKSYTSLSFPEKQGNKRHTYTTQPVITNSHDHNLILKALSANYTMAVEFPQCAIIKSVATLSTGLGVVVEL